MKAAKNSYRHILKATSLFGGVEAFKIILSIARTKIAALLIGVSGIGILGVLNSTLQLILSLTRLGLDISLVKEISLANNSLTKEKVSKLISVSMRLTWFTGLFGAIIILIFSPWLSIITFGDKSQTLSFVIISIAVLFNQLTVGNVAILQGLKHLKKLAKTTLFTSFFSLIIALFFYYFIGTKGIPFVIAGSAIISFIFSKYFVLKLKLKKIKVSFKEVVGEGKAMLRLGFVLSLGGLVGYITFFIIQIFIANVGGINEVGLYSAGFVIINSYVAVFFSALSKDFFPRLSAVSKDKILVNQIVNEQALISILLLTPMVVVFIPFAPVITSVLYTKDFTPIIQMVSYGILGTLFKAVSWPIALVIVAKGDSLLYLKTEIFSNILMLLCIGLGYYFGGLTGVGLCFALYYLFYLIIVKLIVTKKHQFYFNTRFVKLFYICIALSILMVYVTFIKSEAVKICLMLVVGIISITFTIIQLNKYVDLIDFFKVKLKK